MRDTQTMLGILTILALVLPLSMDTLAVSASIGLGRVPAAVRWRVSLAMTAFETAMPIVGLLSGASVAALAGHWSRYLAAAMLVGAGLFFLWESWREDDDQRGLVGAGWLAIAALGLSVSMDELAIGFAGGLARLPVPLLAGLLGLQALIVSQVGLRLGSRISPHYTETGERLAGLALIGCAALVAAQAL